MPVLMRHLGVNNMRKLSMFVLFAIMSALTISGGAQADYVSDYNFDAKLATTKTIPVEIEKTKINVPELVLTNDINVIAPKEDCKIAIKILPGESKIDRDARLAREAAEVEAQARVQDEAQALARTRVRVLPLAGAATGDAWYQLRMCESGNTYARNSGNGYYGAYQFNVSTWRSNAPAGWGDVRPDLAPEAVQDQAALNLFNARGWSPWPACTRKLGLR